MPTQNDENKNELKKEYSDCEMCLKAVADLLNTLKEREGEEKKETKSCAVAALTRSFNIFPVHIADKCRNMLKQDFKSIVRKKVKNFNPEQICSFLGLCEPDPKIAKFDFYRRR